TSNGDMTISGPIYTSSTSAAMVDGAGAVAIQGPSFGKVTVAGDIQTHGFQKAKGADVNIFINSELDLTGTIETYAMANTNGSVLIHGTGNSTVNVLPINPSAPSIKTGPYDGANAFSVFNSGNVSIQTPGAVFLGGDIDTQSRTGTLSGFGI